MAERRRKTVNGKTRSLLLTQEQDERLNALLERTGLNRNQFVRLCAEAMTPSDVEQLQARLGG